MAKALLLFVYRHAGMDCTNGGISSSNDELFLLSDDGFIDVDLDNPPDNLVKIGEIMGHKHLEPYAKVSEGYVGWMDGGNIADSSDSRFNKLSGGYPLSIHDRQETQEEYDLLSR